jgi:hypothetical protein
MNIFNENIVLSLKILYCIALSKMKILYCISYHLIVRSWDWVELEDLSFIYIFIIIISFIKNMENATSLEK